MKPQRFAAFLNCITRNMECKKIANILNEEGHRTVKGYEWRVSKVRGVLQNEKYTGDLLLQKCFVRDPVSKACVPNRGELPQYYVEKDHEAIVDKDVFGAVQALMAQRKVEYARPQGHESAFSQKIRCAICGKNYRRKVTAYNVVWCCSTFNTKGKKYCESKVIPEAILQAVFAEVMGLSHFDESVLESKIDHIEACPGNCLFPAQLRSIDGRTSPAVTVGLMKCVRRKP